MSLDDCRIDVNIKEETNRLSKHLVPALKKQLDAEPTEEPPESHPSYIPSSLKGANGFPPPPLNVVLQVVGSRGDVQPFIALGLVLKEKYGHRVRLATHPTFRSFVEENGLEFFSIGGDPVELMAFMVKHPGLMVGMDAFKNGDVGSRRKGMEEIVKGCWRSCFEAGDGTSPEMSDANVDHNPQLDKEQESTDIDSSNKPFIADAIIANPPSFAHVHCAERLGIPLHLMFT